MVSPTALLFLLGFPIAGVLVAWASTASSYSAFGASGASIHLKRRTLRKRWRTWAWALA